MTNPGHGAARLAVEMRGIVKIFPGVRANDGVDLEVRQGEILALVGENGAGKSTLMNILYGLIHADAGEILIEGKPAPMQGPRDAIRHGIGMVHQHFMLIPVFTVGENVVLGSEPVRPGGFYDHGRARTATHAEGFPPSKTQALRSNRPGWIRHPARSSAFAASSLRCGSNR